MLNFGISYISLILIFLMAVPNIIWTKAMPVDYEEKPLKERKVFQILEQAGRIVSIILAVIFSDFNINEVSAWIFWLILAFVMILCYYVDWIRYFRSGRSMADMYDKAGLSVFPVLSFLFLGIYGANIFLIVSVLLFGIGHIGIHIQYYRALEIGKRKKKSALALFGRIAGIFAGAVASLVLLAIIVVIGIRTKNYLSHLPGSNGVNEQIYVSLNGMEQYLLVRGNDVENPVIVWLHGGPASPDAWISYPLIDELVDDYTVIAWDQRGCGRTYMHNRSVDPENKTVSFETAQKDLDALVDYALERFGKEKVILIGHSYGTVVGSQYAISHPEKLHMYIGNGQVNNIESEIYVYEEAKKRAVQAGEDTSEMDQAYQKYSKEKYLSNMSALRSYTAKYFTQEKEADMVSIGLFSPYAKILDLQFYFMAQFQPERFEKLNHSLFDYILNVNVPDYGTDFQIPVAIITGSEDWVTPVKYQKDYYEMISAPVKDYFEIPGCGHMVMYDDTEAYVSVLKTWMEGNLEDE